MFHHDLSVMDHKRISRRGPAKGGAKLRIGGPLNGVVKLKGEGLLHRLHGDGGRLIGLCLHCVVYLLRREGEYEDGW